MTTTTTKESYDAKLATSDVPEHLRDGLALYLAEGYQPGHFLTAALENNLTQAVSHGDDSSLAGLPAIVRWLYNHAPSTAWGSPARVDTWISERRAERADRAGRDHADAH